MASLACCISLGCHLSIFKIRLPGLTEVCHNRSWEQGNPWPPLEARVELAATSGAKPKSRGRNTGGLFHSTPVDRSHCPRGLRLCLALPLPLRFSPRVIPASTFWKWSLLIASISLYLTDILVDLLPVGLFNNCMQKREFLTNIITFLHAFRVILPKEFNKLPCKFISPQHKNCSIYCVFSQGRVQKLHLCVHCSICTLMKSTLRMFSENKIQLANKLLQVSYWGEKNV